MRLRFPPYRFTFFQRQFLSHLFIAVLLLLPLGFGFIYYAKHSIIYKNKSQELVSASKVVARTLTREEKTKADQVLADYKTLLTDRKITVFLLNRKGDLINTPALFTVDTKNKELIDSLRKHIFNIQNDVVFIIDKKAGSDPMMVAPRIVKPFGEKENIYQFVVAPVRGLDETITGINTAILYIAGAFFLLVIGISLWLSRSMSRRVRHLQDATRQIAGGDYTFRLEAKRTDELGDLSRDFNRMASQLEEASEKLTHFESRRQQFMSDVSHELRTPLTSIRGIIEGFRNNLVAPDDQAKYYSIIEKETFRLIRLINELMDIERIRTQSIQLDLQWHKALDILEVVSESLEVLATEKQLKIEVECTEEVRFYGDYDRLMQITINLVKNAIQFSDYGTIRLKAVETELNTLMEVSDQGRGMSRDQTQRMWERFYKADPSRAKDKSETGLGLSIVKQLVEAHGGTIEVQSELGIGTTLLLTFPKIEQSDSSEQDSDSA